MTLLRVELGAVSLSVGEREAVALVGHDTLRLRLARIAAGLERGGAVRFAGHDVSGAPPARIAALGLGYVPAGRRVFGGLTVAENLAVGAYRDRRDTAAVAARLATVHARFPRLAERAAQAAGTLSGGEQQLLVIARALMAAPRLLILEDPSAGLGPPVVAAVAEALADADLALLIVDEGLSLARARADRVVLVEGGRVTLDAPRAQALTDERLGLGYITGSSSTA